VQLKLTVILASVIIALMTLVKRDHSLQPLVAQPVSDRAPALLKAVRP